ncbi:tyrosine kinase receptor Cad96Ca [Lutzomyia longipalpis]|uniref:tyrosine kinase receptor Cad96Ca n=1 Tax=Lutzomyia longipalpis TaxID=7200 RepID=UPI002483C56A|nr:tyrosine kinase receptor Cad96Ca [Lutzomyia longipalpis]
MQKANMQEPIGSQSDSPKRRPMMAANIRIPLVILLILIAFTKPGQCQLNSPPIMTVDRNWRIFDTHEVGSFVTQVHALDDENDPLEFGLEPWNGNFGSSGGHEERMPFRIDPQTGIVYLNESLAGWAGQNFFIYVTVSDGQLTAKNEVYVNILSKNNSKGSDLYNPRPPGFTPSAKNISSLFPPFHSLPGVPNSAKLPAVPNGYAYVNEPNFSPTGPPTDGKPSTGGGGGSTGHKTVLRPIDGTTKNLTQYHVITDDAEKSANGEGAAGGTEGVPVGTVIPIVLTVGGIFLVAAIVALLVFRKHVCAIGKSLKKKSKEEMAKKSNQSNVSSTLTEDSRNSMVLHHWNGPLAFNNRYVPWERENQHPQATSQLSNLSQESEFTKDPWDFPRHRLKFFNIIGEGAFGQVWRCEAAHIDGKDGLTTVAVKTLKENATEVEKHDLLSELTVMKSLEPHINVVRLLGCCTEKEPIFVILEYVNKGKLQTYLRNSRAEKHYGNTHGKSNILTSGDLTSFMYQVARGMDFLSSRGIIHRDLAARNILITDEHTCKVADFGFARDVVTSKIYERKSEGKLPIRWMAIESLYDNIFSVKSDIWSFGILMWEIVTLGSTPYPGIAAAEVMRQVRDGYRLEKPEHCRRELYNIMYYCWAKDANERPGFSELVVLLDKLLLTETDYIELERFPDHNYYNMLSLSGEKL